MSSSELTMGEAEMRLLKPDPKRHEAALPERVRRASTRLHRGIHRMVPRPAASYSVEAMAWLQGPASISGKKLPVTPIGLPGHRSPSYAQLIDRAPPMPPAISSGGGHAGRLTRTARSR